MSKPSSRDTSKKESTDPTSAGSPISDSDGGGYGPDTPSRQSNFSSYADYTSRDVSEEIDDDEPPLSERIATYRDDDVSLIRINIFSYNMSDTISLSLSLSCIGLKKGTI